MSIERRVVEDLRAFADLDVTDDDVERARLSFRARIERPVVRRVSTARRLTAAATAAAIAAGGIWWASRPGGDSSLPAVQPSISRGAAFIGVPPEGAVPSAPERGKLVLEVPGHATGCGLNSPSGSPETLVGSVHVYADGRVIRAQHANLPEGANPRFTGYLERRLTPVGVERLLSEALRVGRAYDAGPNSSFSRWWCVTFAWALEGTTRVPLYRQDGAEPFGYAQLYDLSWLPASLWAEPSWHGYVASEFAVCHGALGSSQRLGKEAALALLPDRAARLLRPRSAVDEKVVKPGYATANWCAVLPTEEARTLAVELDRARIPRDDQGAFALGYRLDSSAGDAAVTITFEPMLPHGDSVASAAG